MQAINLSATSISLEQSQIVSQAERNVLLRHVVLVDQNLAECRSTG